MANIEIKMARSGEDGYSERVEVDLRLKTTPSQEDYQEIIAAVLLLESMYLKYATVEFPSKTVEVK